MKSYKKIRVLENSHPVVKVQLANELLKAGNIRGARKVLEEILEINLFSIKYALLEHSLTTTLDAFFETIEKIGEHYSGSSFDIILYRWINWLRGNNRFEELFEIPKEGQSFYENSKYNELTKIWKDSSQFRVESFIEDLAKLYSVSYGELKQLKSFNLKREFFRLKLKSNQGSPLDVYNLFQMGDRDKNYLFELWKNEK